MRESKAARALYDNDFVLWLEEQGRALRGRRLADLDVPNIIEEIEALGRDQRRELGSRISVVLTHLLKLAYRPARKSRSWRVTLFTQRGEIARLLEASPSLRRLIPEAIQHNYPRARRAAALETALSLKRFPADCPFEAAEVLADG